MFNWLRDTAANERVTDNPGVEIDAERKAVDEAIRLIQAHVDKEARNRALGYLAVRDLCPSQKADLVRDLARLFR
jgi:hypothetical protein